MDTSASEYSFEYMKLTNSRAALRRLESLRIATAPGTITAPSDGKTTSIGLPLPFLASEKLSGPEPTTRSPETMSVTVSLTDLLIFGMFFARSFRYWSPYVRSIAVTHWPT